MHFMAKTPRAIEVKPEWFDEELEAAAVYRESLGWLGWEKEMIRHYTSRGIGGCLLAKTINAKRGKAGLPARTVSSVRSAITRFNNQ